MKEPNYLILIMATDGQLLVDDTCKEAVIRWKVNGEDVVKNF